MTGYASKDIAELATRPAIERAARALATADRGHDDDYWLYGEEVDIVLRETGAAERIRELLSAKALTSPGEVYARAEAWLAQVKP